MQSVSRSDIAHRVRDDKMWFRSCQPGNRELSVLSWISSEILTTQTHQLWICECRLEASQYSTRYSGPVLTLVVLLCLQSNHSRLASRFGVFESQTCCHRFPLKVGHQRSRRPHVCSVCVDAPGSVYQATVAIEKKRKKKKKKKGMIRSRIVNEQECPKYTIAPN